jgi:hypothetical protein
VCGDSARGDAGDAIEPEGPPSSGEVPGVDVPSVSERTIAIRNDAKGLVARSVITLAELPRELPAHALVGGLAVMVRLSETHRVTTDFDEVTADRADAIGLLVAGGAQIKGSGVYLPESGLQLDLLDAAVTLDEVVATTSSDDLEREAVQLAGMNRYALDTAALTDIVVIDHGGDTVAARVTICVALAGALVAMKANSALSSTRDRDKAASDVYDAYRLIRAWGSDVIVGDLASAPPSLRATTAWQIRELFVERADRTAYELRRASVPGVEALAADRLGEVAVVADRIDA